MSEGVVLKKSDKERKTRGSAEAEERGRKRVVRAVKWVEE